MTEPPHPRPMGSQPPQQPASQYVPQPYQQQYWPPGYQYAGAPPPPPKRSGPNVWMVIAGVVVALIVCFGVVLGIGIHHKHAGAGFVADVKPGQCVTTDDFAKYRFTPSSCDSPDAVYEFAGAAAMGICPDGNRAEDGAYTYASRNQDDPKSEQLCFALNMRQGSCYAIDITAKTTTYVDCAQASAKANSHTGVFKVSQRIDGSIDGRRCGTATVAMVFAAPQRVYCLAKLVS